MLMTPRGTLFSGITGTGETPKELNVNDPQRIWGK